MRVVRAALVLVAVTSAGACRSKPAGLREWRAADHSREPGESQQESAPLPVEDDDPLIPAQGLWAVQCQGCHGPMGRGDGVQAPMMHPPDMTSPAFQQGHTDAQIALSILRGKNLMPAFGGQLRPEAIPLLVQLVRAFGHAPGAPSANPVAVVP